MTGKPIALAGQICPLLNKDVSKVCHKCSWYTHLRGKNPQTGGDLDQWACSIAFLPTLLTENARVSRGTSAAVESFRNEVVKATNSAIAWRSKQTRWLPSNFLRNSLPSLLGKSRTSQS